MRQLALYERIQLALAILKRSTKRPRLSPYAAAYLLQPLDGDAFAREPGSARQGPFVGMRRHHGTARHYASGIALQRQEGLRMDHGTTYRYVPDSS
jgi:hypothetical protein